MSTVMNVVTDAVLTVECGVLGARLQTLGAAGEAWSAFFRRMAVATAAGGVRHAVPEGSTASIAALLTLDIALGLAVFAAQRAAAAWRRDGESHRLLAVFRFQICAFWAAALLRHDFLPALANTAIGLGWVLVAALAAGGRGERGASTIARGLFVGVGAGVAYVLGRGPALWFDHVDVAHTVMIASLLLLYRGASARAVAS